MFNRMHHLEVDIEGLNVPKSEGGRGLMQLEMNFKTTATGLINICQQPMTGCFS